MSALNIRLNERHHHTVHTQIIALLSDWRSCCIHLHAKLSVRHTAQPTNLCMPCCRVCEAAVITKGVVCSSAINISQLLVALSPGFRPRAIEGRSGGQLPPQSKRGGGVGS
eukprot:6530080-Prymnesium_polylepis.1